MSERQPGMGMETAPGRGLIPDHKYMAGTCLALVLLALVLLLWIAILQPQVLPIKHVRVEGDFIHLSPGGLKHIATNVVRGGFFNVNVQGIKSALLQEAWVREVTVRRVWPDGLIVYITEQQPLARWGDKALLNGEAEVFTPSRDLMPAALPLLAGPVGSHKRVLDKYDTIHAMLSSYHLEVASLSLTKRRAWRFKLVDGPLVMIGSKQVDERLKRFSEFVLTQFAGDLLNAELIDMRYTNGFAVKWDEGLETAVAGLGEHG